MASIAKQKLGNKKDFQVHQKAQEIGKIVNETELRFSNQNSNQEDYHNLLKCVDFYSRFIKYLPESSIDAIRLCKIFLRQLSLKSINPDNKVFAKIMVICITIILSRKEESTIRTSCYVVKDVINTVPHNILKSIAKKHSHIVGLVFHKMCTVQTKFTQIQILKLFLLFTQDLINLRSDIIKKHKIMICKDKQIVEDAIKSLNRVDIQNIDVTSSVFLTILNQEIVPQSTIFSTEGYILSINRSSIKDCEYMIIDFNGCNLTISFHVPLYIIFNESTRIQLDTESFPDINEPYFVETECSQIHAKEILNGGKLSVALSLELKNPVIIKSDQSKYDVSEIVNIRMILEDSDIKLKAFCETFLPKFKENKQMTIEDTLLEQESMKSYQTCTLSLVDDAISQPDIEMDEIVNRNTNNIQPLPVVETLKMMSAYELQPTKQTSKGHLPNLTQSQANITQSQANITQSQVNITQSAKDQQKSSFREFMDQKRVERNLSKLTFSQKEEQLCEDPYALSPSNKAVEPTKKQRGRPKNSNPLKGSQANSKAAPLKKNISSVREQKSQKAKVIKNDLGEDLFEWWQKKKNESQFRHYNTDDENDNHSPPRKVAKISSTKNIDEQENIKNGIVPKIQPPSSRVNVERVLKEKKQLSTQNVVSFKIPLYEQSTFIESVSQKNTKTKQESKQGTKARKSQKMNNEENILPKRKLPTRKAAASKKSYADSDYSDDEQSQLKVNSEKSIIDHDIDEVNPLYKLKPYKIATKKTTQTKNKTNDNLDNKSTEAIDHHQTFTIEKNNVSETNMKNNSNEQVMNHKKNDYAATKRISIDTLPKQTPIENNVFQHLKNTDTIDTDKIPINKQDLSKKLSNNRLQNTEKEDIEEVVRENDQDDDLVEYLQEISEQVFSPNHENDSSLKIAHVENGSENERDEASTNSSDLIQDHSYMECSNSDDEMEDESKVVSSKGKIKQEATKVDPRLFVYERYREMEIEEIKCIRASWDDLRKKRKRIEDNHNPKIEMLKKENKKHCQIVTAQIHQVLQNEEIYYKSKEKLCKLLDEKDKITNELRNVLIKRHEDLIEQTQSEIADRERIQKECKDMKQRVMDKVWGNYVQAVYQKMNSSVEQFFEI